MQNQHVMLTGYGSPDHLILKAGGIPTPGPDELLLRVEFAGVAFADLMVRHGKYHGAPKLPMIPGYDVVGTVQQSGTGAGVPIGARVAALTQFGGYAQYVTVKADTVVEVPAAIPSEHAVCMVLNYLSAYQMLCRTAKLSRGDSLLVHSAAGGVGTAALQLGAYLGLSVIGTASSSKLGLVRRLGASPIDYRNQDFVAEVKALSPNGLDAVLDPIGPENWKRSRRCLKRNGHLIGFGGLGMLNREKDQLDGNVLQLVAHAAKLKLFTFGSRFTFFAISLRQPARTREDLQAIFRIATEGAIEPIISDILPLGAAAEAHRRLALGKTEGKLVLDCR